MIDDPNIVRLQQEKCLLIAAIEELLKYGEHEGDCDNKDDYWEQQGPCQKHLDASAKRQEAAKLLIARLR